MGLYRDCLGSIGVRKNGNAYLGFIRVKDHNLQTKESNGKKPEHELANGDIEP